MIAKQILLIFIYIPSQIAIFFVVGNALKQNIWITKYAWACGIASSSSSNLKYKKHSNCLTVQGKKCGLNP